MRRGGFVRGGLCGERNRREVQAGVCLLKEGVIFSAHAQIRSRMSRVH